MEKKKDWNFKTDAGVFGRIILLSVILSLFSHSSYLQKKYFENWKLVLLIAIVFHSINYI